VLQIKIHEMLLLGMVLHGMELHENI